MGHDITALVELPTTDEQYREWVSSHWHGYIVNAAGFPQDPNAKWMIWHRADCDHMSLEDQVRYVTDSVIKACSDDPGALVEWAMKRGGNLGFCKTCCAKLRSEQLTSS